MKVQFCDVKSGEKKANVLRACICIWVDCIFWDNCFLGDLCLPAVGIILQTRCQKDNFAHVSKFKLLFYNYI